MADGNDFLDELGDRRPAPVRVFTGAGARRAAVAWLVVGTIGFLGYRPIFYWISYAYVLVITLWAAVGAVLAIRLGSRLSGSGATTLGTALAFAIVPLFFVIVAVAREPIVRTGDRLFTRVHFALNHKHYDAVVAEFDASDPPCGKEWDRSCVTRSGTVFRFDVGPPVRIVFPRAGGSADDWIGVVHDPSDEIADASSSQPPSFTGFDSRTTECDPLNGHYFACRFRR